MFVLFFTVFTCTFQERNNMSVRNTGYLSKEQMTSVEEANRSLLFSDFTLVEPVLIFTAFDMRAPQEERKVDISFFSAAYENWHKALILQLTT